MKTSPAMTMTAVVLASLALAGCGRRDELQTAGTNERAAVVQGGPNAADAAARASREAAETTRQAAAAAKETSKNAADQASNKVADALITTSVNAELAKDPALSAMRIDVDTDNGRVALRGSAPDQAAKERATQLASNVTGVVSVDNHLEVQEG